MYCKFLVFELVDKNSQNVQVLTGQFFKKNKIASRLKTGYNKLSLTCIYPTCKTIYCCNLCLAFGLVTVILVCPYFSANLVGFTFKH
jgi:hypothetical protein